MKIHRSYPEARFTVIPDETLRDPRLSYLARGILAEILSRPDDWQTKADDLATRAQRERAKAGEGRRAIRAAFEEMRAAGYLRRVTARGPGGRIVTELHFYDQPQTDVPDGGTPVSPVQAVIPNLAADVPDGGTPVEDVSAGRIDVPLTERRLTGIPATDIPVGGTSIRRPKKETSLSRAAAAMRAAVPGSTEREIDATIDRIRADPKIRNTAAYLTTVIANGDAAVLVAEMRPAPADAAGPVWCGTCDERTRMRGFDDDDHPRRCQTCHPRAAPTATAAGSPPVQAMAAP